MSVAIPEETAVLQPEETDSPYSRFMAINEARLNRIHASLSQRKKTFLYALPMLFHANDKSLPGYISEKTPFGIVDYDPSGETLFEARRIARDNKIGKKAPRKFGLLGLYFIGSPGTIAYNGQSDFDIWVFVDPEIDADGINELQQKAKLIEAWAAKSDIEVHFFIINPYKFRSGETLPLSAESSGSSQHGLLLDEFYRSSVLIAGQPLAWWLVPPHYETQYDSYIQSQQRVEMTDQPSFDQCIDLGPLTEIPAEEFFGAAIWQLNKSITAPYKSVLKLLLMEVYANDESGISLISHQFKNKVYDGITDINQLDPWLLMFRQVEEYLLDQNDDLRLNVLRRSFYLKIHAALSDGINKNYRFASWKQKLTRDLVAEWGWDEELIQKLDSRDHWKLETVLREKSDLVNTLTKSFRILSRFAHQQTENPRISQTDLQLLNRRLFSAFERKAGKIEIINRGISPDISESTVSLHLIKTSPESNWGLNEARSGSSSWVLYRGIVTPQDLGDSTHLKHASSLIEMLAWCYFNRVLTENSKIMLYLPPDQQISQNEIQTIRKALNTQLPLTEIIGNDALAAPVRIASGAIFVNTGLEPKPDSERIDTYLATERSNALSYGGQHENLIKTFDLVFTTSWGETFIKHYSGIDGLVDCLTDYMSWAPPSQKRLPTVLDVHCYSPAYGAPIRNTLTTLFNDIVGNFYGEDGSAEGHYILEVEDGFHSIEVHNDVISHHVLENLETLMEYLSRSRTSFSQVYFGPHACSGTLLPAIYAQNRADAVQLFFEFRNGKAKVFVLDEKGSLFVQTNTYINKRSLFDHYQIFTNSIIERVAHNDLTSLLQDNECVCELYLIENDPIDGYRIEPIKQTYDHTGNFLSLQVLCDLDETYSEQYTIYCRDQEFSSLEYGEELFDKVARQIMKFRGSRQAYPVYITDIDLSQSMLNDHDKNQFQSCQFFRYKKHIESKLTRALEKL